VETAEVAPTLLRVAGIRDVKGKQLQARGLLDAVTTTDDDAAYSETLYPFSSFGWSPLHSLETSRYHYIEAPKPELYDLENDKGESNNIAAQQSATVAVLKEKLAQRLTIAPYSPQVASAGSLSPDAQEKLRALGYFGFKAPISAEALKTGLPDPKEKLWEFNTILTAEDALQRQDDDQAETLLRQVQERDPNIYVIPFLLGESAVRRQNWSRAAEQLQLCLKLNPNFDNAMTGLARALAKLGRVQEAGTWLRNALQINPQNYRAWYETGLLQSGSDPGAALAAYQKTVAIQPNFHLGQRELGLALFNQKEYAGAAIHLQKAIALGIEDAHIHNFLGICYSQLHQLTKAVREHQRAVELDPTLAEAHLNLAHDYQLQNRNSAAREHFQTACRLEAKFCAFVPSQ
jgi:tetratricopeptide (TPR) repeat protein